jgi:hypothetical protein
MSYVQWDKPCCASPDADSLAPCGMEAVLIRAEMRLPRQQLGSGVSPRLLPSAAIYARSLTRISVPFPYGALER